MRKEGLVEESVSLGMGFAVLKVHARPRFSLAPPHLFLSPSLYFSPLMNQNVTLSYCSSTYLPAWYHAPCHDDNWINPLKRYSSPN